MVPFRLLGTGKQQASLQLATAQLPHAIYTALPGAREMRSDATGKGHSTALECVSTRTLLTRKALRTFWHYFPDEPEQLRLQTRRALRRGRMLHRHISGSNAWGLHKAEQIHRRISRRHMENERRQSRDNFIAASRSCHCHPRVA